MAYLTGNCAEDPVSLLISSPCTGYLTLGEALQHEIVRHNWIDRGWRVRIKGAAVEVERIASLNKMTDIHFTWRVQENAVTATHFSSASLCKP